MNYVSNISGCSPVTIGTKVVFNKNIETTIFNGDKSSGRF